MSQDTAVPCPYKYTAGYESGHGSAVSLQIYCWL